MNVVRNYDSCFNNQGSFQHSPEGGWTVDNQMVTIKSILLLTLYNTAFD